MSEDKDHPEHPIKIDLGAKAEAKFQLTAEIPKEPMGRLVDALTDMIRPFSERRGLRADLLRLQREEVIIEIARKARQRAAEEHVAISAVPNKFLVPFLEKASTEEVDSELVERWADLLLTASSKYESRYLLYTSILAHLGPEDAAFLRKMICESRGRQDELVPGHVRHFEDTPGIFEYKYHEIRDYLDRSVSDDDGTSSEAHLRELVTQYEWPGVYFRIISFQDENDRSKSITKYNGRYEHNEQFSISALESQGLIEAYKYRHEWALLHAEIYSLTHLGADFYRCCNRPGRVG
ncbi:MULTISPECIES: Abi-alpha family protein [unclassified Bradyrhizobium]|uniref:Abi-alpha family protein n=1 Tax=unclassified Bradyrhizobium TaxID=2631580 RepID=UPI0028E7F3E7|nr:MULTISPECIES: Abi-alpha family protein [unclassified Bradyrhizobium]